MNTIFCMSNPLSRLKVSLCWKYNFIYVTAALSFEQVKASGIHTCKSNQPRTVKYINPLHNSRQISFNKIDPTTYTAIKFVFSFLPTQFGTKSSLQLANYLLIWNGFPRLILLDHLRLLIDNLQSNMLVLNIKTSNKEIN